MTPEELRRREEVRQLRLAYAALLDAQDVDGLAMLFAEDATCGFGGYGTWRGREEVRANYRATMREIGEPFDAIHCVTNETIVLDGPDRAEGRWYLTDILTRQAPATGMSTRGGHDRPILWLGYYHDRCARIGGRWQFTQVTLHFLWPGRDIDLAELATGTVARSLDI